MWVGLSLQFMIPMASLLTGTMPFFNWFDSPAATLLYHRPQRSAFYYPFSSDDSHLKKKEHIYAPTLGGHVDPSPFSFSISFL